MAPNKQKIVAPKHGRPAKLQATTSAPSPAPTPAPEPERKIRLKLTFKRGEAARSQLPASGYKFPLSAPPSDDGPAKEDAYDSIESIADGQGIRRGARQRKAPQRDDVVYGSEMDNLITSSTTIAKAEDDDSIRIASPRPAVFSMRAPERYKSLDTVQGTDAPPVRCDPSTQNEIYDILNALGGSPKVQVELPNMTEPGEAKITKPYTAYFLTHLYIQCYEYQLWHLCDVIADTWIRALQKANTRSHKYKDERKYLWRENPVLNKRFHGGKKGFKEKAPEYGLEVEDAELSPDVTNFNAARLQELYDGTAPKCGARLLWADAMALAGRNMEIDITRRPGVWPKELFFDVMCTSLRLVGRKLTLKIEEKYEGAWCRYHEHGKHGLPCYRKLAYEQKGDDEDEDDGVDRDDVSGGAAVGEKRTREAAGFDGWGAKRVRFGTGDAGDSTGFGDVDAEGESEEG